jgi:cell shape-determining protein MreC|tara:strand:+ start:6 stop:272 length:267 start_codon:yes stop_codon:yes gene_type:complete
MIKELKYFLYTITIISFIFFILNYYFSDENKKNSYRSTKIFDTKIVKYSETLQTLESDTENIVEYIENTFNKDKKKYKFWELIIDNDK